MADNFEITCTEMQLGIDVKIITDFPQCILDQQNLAAFYMTLELYFSRMLHKQRDFRLVFSALQVDVTCDQLAIRTEIL